MQKNVLKFVNVLFMNGLDVKKLRKKLGYSQSDFGKVFDKSLRTVQNWESSDKLSTKIELLIQSKFSNYLNTEENTQIIAQEPNALWTKYESYMLVPIVHHRAQAGFLSGWGDTEYLEELPKVPFEVDREYKGRYVCFEVSGESMESEDEPRDSIYEGDTILCREVQKHHWQNKLHINKWDFVIVHREQGILAKRIIKHDTEKGTLTLHSLNPYYEDQVVNMDDLIAIFNIIDVKRSRKRR